MRTIKTYPISDFEELKFKILGWAQQFNEVVWLDGNDYPLKEEKFRAILAVDALTSLMTDSYQGFDMLKEYQTATMDWIFGFLSYDLKNDVEDLRSNNQDGLGFPDLYFFQPQKLFLFSDDTVEIQYLNGVAHEMETDWVDIQNFIAERDTGFQNPMKIQSRTSRESYLRKVKEILGHI